MDPRRGRVLPRARARDVRVQHHGAARQQAHAALALARVLNGARLRDHRPAREPVRPARVDNDVHHRRDAWGVPVQWGHPLVQLEAARLDRPRLGAHCADRGRIRGVRHGHHPERAALLGRDGTMNVSLRYIIMQPESSFASDSGPTHRCDTSTIAIPDSPCVSMTFRLFLYTYALLLQAGSCDRLDAVAILQMPAALRS